MSSPWGKITKPEPPNLQEIMSEEFARDLQAKEDQKYAGYVQPVTNPTDKNDVIPDSPELDADDSDAIIARMLQKQFDEEYDDMLKRTEDKVNGTSKVSVSFSNYRRTPQSLDFDSDSEEYECEDIMDRRDWDRFDTMNRQLQAIPPCGYMIKDGKMVTKHDPTLNSRKNACKFMSFPPEFHTGDGAGFDLQLSNKVFNSLKLHSKTEQNRRQRLHDRKEDHATADFGIDQFTRLLLYKMINKQLLERVNGIISIGKEAVILHAETDPLYPEGSLPKECVIKIFKTTLAEFKQREKYIRDDHRFKDKIGKQRIRRTIHIWAEKEMHNLMRVKKAGIPCPEVIASKRHVLVMSFIGENNCPAPKLKDALLDSADYIVAYDQVVDGMKVLYTQANLIHADLSEYNILWHNDQCYFIDVSQSTEPTHNDAFHFLMRDCENVTNFFSRKDVPNMRTARELFVHITGCDFNDRIALEALRNTFKMKPHLVGKPGMEPHESFEATWAKMKEGEIPLATTDVANNIENINIVDAVPA